RKEFQFFHAMPEALQEQIAGQMADMSLMTGYFSGTLEEGCISIPFTDLPQKAQESLLAEAEGFSKYGNAKLDDVVVRFNNIGMSVAVSLILPSGKTTHSGVSLHSNITQDAKALDISHSRLADAVQKMG